MSLTQSLLRAYTERFNADDEETVINEIPNDGALQWMEAIALTQTERFCGKVPLWRLAN